MSEEVEEPKVVDKEAFKKYTELRELISSQSVKTYEWEGENITVNLNTSPRNWNVIRVKYPEELRKLMDEDHKQLKSWHGKSIQIKVKAYGTKYKSHLKDSYSILSKRKEEIIEYFGRHFNVRDVHKIIVQDWALESVDVAAVTRIFRENIDLIEEKKIEYQRSHSNVRLGHKRSRLDELTYLYEDRKSKYTSSHKAEDYKLLLTTIDQIRKEVEGEKFTFEGKIEVDIESTLKIHVQQQAIKGLNINSVIISRVASRLGLPSRYFIDSLNKSFYAKHSGFSIERAIEEENPLYPSQVTYDWDEIKRNEVHRQKRDEDLKIQEQPTNSQLKLDNLKKRLLNDINSRIVDVETTKDRVNRMDNVANPTNNENDRL